MDEVIIRIERRRLENSAGTPFGEALHVILPTKLSLLPVEKREKLREIVETLKEELGYDYNEGEDIYNQKTVHYWTVEEWEAIPHSSLLYEEWGFAL